MAEPDRTTERAPHPDTPEWFLPHAQDLRELVREMSGVAVNLRAYLGKTMELLETVNAHEQRLQALEKWHKETTRETGRHSTLELERRSEP